MLQRSPTYILSLPARDPIADALQRRLPAKLAYSLLRRKNALLMILHYQLCRQAPSLMRRQFRRLAAKQLPPGYDLDTHLKPTYDPWDQRLCLAPDGDLFQAVSAGRASIVTDQVESFTESSVKLSSGRELSADLIITATGLNLLALGGLELAVDGARVDIGASVAYKGMMLCGVPNMALTLGYANASWTLKADLVAEYVCRLLRHMDERGFRTCTPLPPDPSLPTLPILDLKSGYVLRSIELLPKQSTRPPWRLHQNYFKDLRMLRRGRIDDGVRFSGARAAHEHGGDDELAVAA